MVLVPKDQCNLLLKSQVQDISPAAKMSIHLDDQMSHLLMQEGNRLGGNKPPVRVQFCIVSDKC